MNQGRMLDLQFAADLDQDWAALSEAFTDLDIDEVKGLIARLTDGPSLVALEPDDGPLVADLALLALRQITLNILNRATQDIEESP